MSLGDEPEKGPNVKIIPMFHSTSFILFRSLFFSAVGLVLWILWRLSISCLINNMYQKVNNEC